MLPGKHITCFYCLAPMRLRDMLAIARLPAPGPNRCLRFECGQCGCSVIIPPEAPNRRALDLDDDPAGTILTDDGVTTTGKESGQWT